MDIEIKSIKYGTMKCYIDDCDYESIKDYKWHISKGKTGFYARSNIKGKKTLMHRYLMNFPQNGVDHKNSNGLDNRRDNLRNCSQSENLMNLRKRKTATSIYKGVNFNKALKKYASRIQRDKKQIHLGYFETEDQAAVAYNMAAVKYFGEFARPNVNIMMHKGVN